MENIVRCKNNPENVCIAKVSEHIPLGFSMSTIWPFESIVIKHIACRGKDWMQKR